jgi:hypothetical protein
MLNADNLQTTKIVLRIELRTSDIFNVAKCPHKRELAVGAFGDNLGFAEHGNLAKCPKINI